MDFELCNILYHEFSLAEKRDSMPSGTIQARLYSLCGQRGYLRLQQVRKRKLHNLFALCKSFRLLLGLPVRQGDGRNDSRRYLRHVVLDAEEIGCAILRSYQILL